MNKMLIPETQGGRMLKRGDTFDIECWRTTHRLRVGQGILRGLGIEQTWEHSDAQRCDFGRMRHECDDRCKCHWPEWVTGKVFDLAYQLACETQTKRGEHERGLAARSKTERDRAEALAFADELDRSARDIQVFIGEVAAAREP